MTSNIEMTQRRDSMPLDERFALLGALSSVFAILSEVFLEPEADVKLRLAEILGRCPSNCPGLDGLPVSLAGMLKYCDGSQAQAVEYVRLFLHGSGCPAVHPYESIYTCGRLMAPECLDDLRALHEVAGLRPGPGVSLPPDHLGLELEFLAFVVEQIIEPDGSQTEQWKVIAEKLLRRHMVPFSRLFVGRLGEANPHLYYASAGKALVHGLQACTLLLDINLETVAAVE